MSESTLKKLVIVGTGMNVAMVSSILSAQLGRHGVELVVVEIESENAESVAETCGPEFWPLCELNGVNPQEVIARSKGTFRLGSRYRCGARDWFVPFGSYGLQASAAGFESAMLKVLRLSTQGDIDDCSLAAAAAARGRFAIPGRDRPDLCNALKAGVTLSLPHYRRYLADVARERGVRFVQTAGVSGIERGAQGWIRRLTLAGGEAVDGDFWIDCTGDAGLLQMDRKTQPFELPWDSVASVSHEGVPEPLPADDYVKTAGGWLRKKRLQGAVHWELYYRRSEVSDAALEEALAAPAALTLRRLSPGISPSPWSGNCLGVGSAVTNLGELAFSELALVQAGIVQFLDLYPVCPGGPWDARHYNRQWSDFAREAGEYTLLHAVLDEAVTPNAFLDGRLPEALAQKLAVFTHRGRIEEPDSDAVSETQWLGMVYGMGLRPAGSPLNLEPIADEKILAGVEKIRERIRATVTGMPSHQAFIDKYFKHRG